MPKSYFDIPHKMMFEGHEFPLPREWDKYLTHIYGDYMVPDMQA
jgi:phosphorylcholine metabolism protein LicD